MTLSAAIVRLQALAVTAGANEAPPNPVETNVAWPFSVCYLSSAKIMGESGGAERDLATLFLDLHVNRVDLPTDVQAVMAFYEAFKPLLIADPTLNNAVSTVLFGSENPVNVEFGQMKYAGIDTLGLRFTITVKQRS